jgi:quercetin dioxygenase-like cupin family protein
MGRLRIIDNPDSMPWMGREISGESVEDEDTLVELDDESRLAGRFYHPGGENELQMFELRLGPNDEIPAHAHDVDEIVYVVSGQLRFGSRILNPGSSVYIPGESLYSLRAGPEGLRFLNFRPCKDISMISKEELAHRKSSRRHEAAEKSV